MAWGMLRGRMPAPAGRALGARAVFLAQLPLTGATAFVLVALAIFEPALLGVPWLVVGCLLVLVITVFALVVPWSRLPPSTVALLPIVDIVAIGLMHVPGDLIRLSVLLFLPAIWLASWFYAAGAAVAFALGAFVVWWPQLFSRTGPMITDFTALRWCR